MQNIESMPRPEIILVADTVAREKNIDKEDVFTAMEVAIQKAGVPNTVLNMTSAPILTARPALFRWPVTVRLSRVRKMLKTKLRS